MKGPVACALMIAALTAMASPASAHGGTAVKATNDRVEIVGLDPQLPGVEVRLVDAGTRIELDAGDHRVFVLGYEGEDYLRIDHLGVYENLRSPATYLNRSLTGEPPPPIADATAAPVWHRVSDGTVVRWHDHALHVPPGMKLGRQASSDWERPLLIDDELVSIKGRIVRLPARSRVPWLLLAAAISIAVVVMARSWWRTVTCATLAIVVLADGARVIGLVAYAPTWLVSRLRTITDISVLSIVGWGMAVCAVVLLAKRRRFEAATAAAIAGAVLALAGGVLELADLSAAELGTSLPDAPARTAVAIVLGGGLGVSLATGLELRRGMSRPARRAPRSDSEPNQGDGTRTASPPAPPSG